MRADIHKQPGANKISDYSLKLLCSLRKCRWISIVYTHVFKYMWSYGYCLLKLCSNIENTIHESTYIKMDLLACTWYYNKSSVASSCVTTISSMLVVSTQPTPRVPTLFTHTRLQRSWSIDIWLHINIID